MDQLVVTPRSPGETHALTQVLRMLLPGIPLRHSPNGINVEARDAAALLDLDDRVTLTWSVEAKLFAENRRRVRNTSETIRQRIGEIVLGGRQAADADLGPTRYPLLDDHQRVNVASMTVSGGYGLCLFDEQGAGKTVSLIFAFDMLVDKDEVDFALIVAPKSMLSEWQRDFERFMGDMYEVGLASGSRRQKQVVMAQDLDVLVTNFETTVSMEGELRALLRQRRGRAMLVVDESFFVKNLDARRTRSVRRLREFCTRAFVLCGTPAPNAAEDLIQQFNIVDFGTTFDGVSLPDDPALVPRVVQEAIDQRGIFVRHLKAEVLPLLPGKRFSRVLLPLEPEQERAYRSALDGLVADLRAIDEEGFRRDLASFLARRSALLQICSHPGAVVPGYTEVPAKFRALDLLLDDLVQRKGEKVVLWSFYRASIAALMARYARFNPVRYDGSIDSVVSRREAVRRFQEDEGTSLFIGNPAAAGAGLTLHSARYAIYESLSNQAAHYLQSLDRIHRRGQVRSVEYIVLLCQETLEVPEYERLVRKELAAQELLRDQVQTPVTREGLLAELLDDRHPRYVVTGRR